MSYRTRAKKRAEPFQFMRLPPELRNKIYQMVLQPHENLQARFIKCFDSDDIPYPNDRVRRVWRRIKWDDNCKPNTSALALACKTTWTEIESMIAPYAEYGFYIYPPWYRSTFSSPYVTATFLSNLRYLTVSLDVVSFGNYFINGDKLDDSPLREATTTTKMLRGDVGAQLVQLTLNTIWDSQKEDFFLSWVCAVVDLPRVKRIGLLVGRPTSKPYKNKWKTCKCKNDCLSDDAKWYLEGLKKPQKGQVFPTHQRKDGSFINFVRDPEEALQVTDSSAVVEAM